MPRSNPNAPVPDAECLLLAEQGLPFLRASLERERGHYVKGAASACWPWVGSTDSNGYAHVYLFLPDGRRFYALAHRIAYYLAHPERKDIDTIRIVNLCGAKACGNPRHWHAVGVKTVRTQATREKQRLLCLRGDDNPNRKLTWEQVKALRAKRADEGKAYTYAIAAKEFGISVAAAGKILRGETWIEENRPIEQFPALTASRF